MARERVALSGGKEVKGEVAQDNGKICASGSIFRLPPNPQHVGMGVTNSPKKKGNKMSEKTD